MPATKSLAMTPRRLIVALALALAMLAATSTSGAMRFGPENTMRAVLNFLGSGYPGCASKSKQWSGYFSINRTTAKQYFYWAFGPQSFNQSAPVMLWMTGGPGCSSALALLAENGPCHVNMTTGELYENPFTWNKDAYVIYIDQPAGVGFSHADADGADSNEAEVAQDMLEFLQAWYTKFPELLKNPLFIFGESYGGHYAPATAHLVWKANQAGQEPRMPLAGLAVGNGLTDAYVQYQSYYLMASEGCKKKIGKSCLSELALAIMRQDLPECLESISRCRSNNEACDTAMVACNAGQIEPYSLTGRNVYDIRKKCDGALCYDFSKVTDFMNRADVQQSLGVRPQEWRACNTLVHLRFIQDWFQSFSGEVGEMLDSGDVRVMIYAGDVDFICNYMGNHAWVKNIDWKGRASFNSAQEMPYEINRKMVATTQSTPSSTGGPLLSFVKVIDAGHMVPMDQPEAILSLVTKFLNNEPWQ